MASLVAWLLPRVAAVSDPSRDEPMDGASCPGVSRRRLLLLALSIVGLLAVVLVVRGDYQTDGPRVLGAGAPRPPGWTRPCWVLHPRTASKPFSLRCARVEGTVLYRQNRDPDGDGDRHLVVVAGLHLVKVKFRQGVGPRSLPGIGSTLRVVGHLTGDSPMRVVEPRAPAAAPAS